jgi:hypothetical protein
MGLEGRGRTGGSVAVTPQAGRNPRKARFFFGVAEKKCAQISKSKNQCKIRRIHYARLLFSPFQRIL